MVHYRVIILFISILQITAKPPLEFLVFSHSNMKELLTKNAQKQILPVTFVRMVGTSHGKLMVNARPIVQKKRVSTI